MSEFVNRRRARRLSDEQDNTEANEKIEIITNDFNIAKGQFESAVKLFNENKERIEDEIVLSLEERIKEITEDIQIVEEDFNYLKKKSDDIEKRKSKLDLKRPRNQERILKMVEDLLVNLDDIEEEVEDLTDVIMDLYEDIENSAGEYYKGKKRSYRFESIEDISKVINKAFDKLKDTLSFDFTNDRSSKTKTLVALLPYLEEEELNEIADMIINDHEDMKGLKLATIFPFLSTEKCDEIFLAKMTSLNQGELSSIVPFVSQKVLSSLVDEYIKGNVSKVNMNAIYPFLSQEDIKRIFFYELKQGN
jgi:uncharacterized protein YoxC